MSLCRCFANRARLFITIKGVQNALKCIKQIEIYYHLNANVYVYYYYTFVRSLPCICLIYAQTQVVGTNKPPPISMVFSFFCLSRFCLFVILYGLNVSSLFATPIFFTFEWCEYRSFSATIPTIACFDFTHKEAHTHTF